MTLDKYLVAKYVIIFRSVSCFFVFFWLVGTRYSTLELYQLRVLDCVVSKLLSVVGFVCWLAALLLQVARSLAS